MSFLVTWKPKWVQNKSLKDEILLASWSDDFAPQGLLNNEEDLDFSISYGLLN